MEPVNTAWFSWMRHILVTVRGLEAGGLRWSGSIVRIGWANENIPAAVSMNGGMSLHRYIHDHWRRSWLARSDDNPARVGLSHHYTPEERFIWQSGLHCSLIYRAFVEADGDSALSFCFPHDSLLALWAECQGLLTRRYWGPSCGSEEQSRGWCLIYCLM